MHAPYCSCCQLALVAPVNFCPRCGTDQRAASYRGAPVAVAAALPAAGRPDTVVYLILGWVFAALALATVSPLIFGPAALVMGALAWSHGSRQGMAIVFVSIAAALLGLLFSEALASLTEETLTAAGAYATWLPL